MPDQQGARRRRHHPRRSSRDLILSTALLRARAAHHRIAGPSFSSVDDAIGHFGCVQSQDFGMARWAVGRRVDGCAERDLDDAFTSGQFVRTHVLRPTWHFVLPQDLAWTMGLTAHRVHRIMASTNKTINLLDAELDAAAEVIVAALSAEQPQTRAQLAVHLAEAGLDASGTRLAHHMMHAELELLICNGPLAGKQHTYVLAPASVTEAPRPEHDEALALLARTYVRGHGPSQPADLSWWSSLTLTETRKAFELADLRQVSIDGTDYWTDDTVAEVEPPVAALVSPFDESISYVAKPLDPVRYPGGYPDLARAGGLLFLDGVIGGTWSRKASAKSVAITVAGFGPLNKKQVRAIGSEAARYGSFLGLEHTVHIAE